MGTRYTTEVRRQECKRAVKRSMISKKNIREEAHYTKCNLSHLVACRTLSLSHWLTFPHQIMAAQFPSSCSPKVSFFGLLSSRCQNQAICPTLSPRCSYHELLPSVLYTAWKSNLGSGEAKRRGRVREQILWDNASILWEKGKERERGKSWKGAFTIDTAEQTVFAGDE